MLNSTDIAPVIFQEGFGKINIAEKREREQKWIAIVINIEK